MHYFFIITRIHACILCITLFEARSAHLNYFTIQIQAWPSQPMQTISYHNHKFKSEVDKCRQLSRVVKMLQESTITIWHFL